MFPRTDRSKDINAINSAHVETVVLLSQQKPSDKIEVDLDLDELDATSGDTTAKFLYAGWTPNWGASTFPYGFGVNGGANIPVVAGKYVAILNDIDGYYHFFSK